MKTADLPTFLPLPFAVSGGRNAIPVASQVSVEPGRASLTDGFPPLTRTPVEAGGVPPFGEDFNGILYEMSAWTRWQGAGGAVPYDAAFAAAIGGYPRGAMLMPASGSGLWISTDDDNVTDPDDSGVGWISLAAAAGASPFGESLMAAADAAAARSTLSAAPEQRLLYFTNSATLTAADAGFLIMPDATAGNVTITLPAANALGTARPFDAQFIRPDASGNTATIQCAGSDIFVGGGTTLSLPPGREITLISDAFGVWYPTINSTPLGRALLGAADAAAAQSLIGPWVQIANFAVTAVTTLEVPLPTTGYAAFRLMLLGVYAASSPANNELYFRVKQGGVLVNGASTYFEQGPYWVGNTGPAPISQTATFGRLAASPNGEPVSTDHIFWPGYGTGTNNRGTMHGLGFGMSQGGNRLTWGVSTQVLASGAQTDALVLGWTQGVNFVANGRCVVLGLKA